MIAKSPTLSLADPSTSWDYLLLASRQTRQQWSSSTTKARIWSSTSCRNQSRSSKTVSPLSRIWMAISLKMCSTQTLTTLWWSPFKRETQRSSWLKISNPHCWCRMKPRGACRRRLNANCPYRTPRRLSTSMAIVSQISSWQSQTNRQGSHSMKSSFAENYNNRKRRTTRRRWMKQTPLFVGWTHSVWLSEKKFLNNQTICSTLLTSIAIQWSTCSLSQRTIWVCMSTIINSVLSNTETHSLGSNNSALILIDPLIRLRTYIPRLFK